MNFFLLRRPWLVAAVLLISTCARVFAIERFHDPSTINKCNGEYWLFTTGTGVKSFRSKDLRTWQLGPPAFENLPTWIEEVVSGHKGYFWAPDCIRVRDRYLLYYSVSGWGKNNSAIGLATSPTLDPADPTFRWKDEGIVIRSKIGDWFNAIDPSLLLDPATNRLWMAFGSFWAGIELVELDPATGQRVQPDSPVLPLAFHAQIEAPCLVAHGGAFYLFVDWGWCCRGVRSTYEIRVGRSANITGPYLDRDGVDLRRDGGTLFLGNEDTRIGPGHTGIFQEGSDWWMSYHFYDATRGGVGTLAVRQLEWDADGWPVPGKVIVPNNESSGQAAPAAGR